MPSRALVELECAKETNSLNKSDLDDMFQTVRDMVADIDFSELLEGVKVPFLVLLPLQAGLLSISRVQKWLEEILPVAAFQEAFARTEDRCAAA